MLDLIQNASTLQFVMFCIALCTFVMIVLQTILNRRVWSGYLIAFLAAIVTLLATLR